MLKRFPVLSGFVCICRGLCGAFVCMLGYAHMEFDIIVCLCFIADCVNTAGLLNSYQAEFDGSILGANVSVVAILISGRLPFYLQRGLPVPEHLGA